MLIDKLNLKWSEPKTVNTRNGARTLRKASPTPAFWGAWRSNKLALKSEGVSCDKNDRDGTWEICLWTNESTESTPVDSSTQQSTDAYATPVASPVPSPSPTSSHPDAWQEVLSKSRVWSDEQKAIFAWFASGKGNVVVGARAGTGKTTTIEEAFKHALEKSIIYLVFNKKNQIEAEGKIKDKRVEIRTEHSLGFTYITSVWPGVKPDNSVEMSRIEAACPGIPEEVAGCVERIIAFAKNTLIKPTIDLLVDLANDRGIFSASEAPEDGGWTVARLASVAFTALELAKERDSEDRISFNDMVWLPVAMNWVSPRFELVVVDEAQDMNVPQLEMAIRACLPGGRICVVGDDRQAIYGFRGAAQDGMRMMQERLDAAKLGLTTTYRCPRAVVALAAQIVPDYNAAPSAPEGIVDEVNSVLEYAKIGDAILSRLNAPLMSTCLNLLKKGISARIEGRDIGAQLVNTVRKLRAKSVPDFFKKLDTWANKQRKRLAVGKNAESKVAQINDTVETLAAVAQDARSVSDIESKIYSLFQDSDSKGAKPAVVLSSVHKAKGLEWSRVFLLQATFKPGRSEEESNIYYVALTRSKKHLTFVQT
jgi:DNA helicase-2/ATP-dependent DNA helicase PcrA